MSAVALDGLHQVWHEVVAALELDVYPGPCLAGEIVETDETVVEKDEKARDGKDRHRQHYHRVGNLDRKSRHQSPSLVTMLPTGSIAPRDGIFTPF